MFSLLLDIQCLRIALVHVSYVSEIPFDLLLLPDRTFDTHLNQRFPRTSFMEDNFSMDPGHRGEMVSGLFKCITFTVYFISVIITPAPPQIIRH